MAFAVGDLIRLRGREWAVDSLELGSSKNSLSVLDLACVDDDAQGERLRVVLGTEIDVRRVEDDLWEKLGREGTDDPEVLAAHLRALTWRSATAADRDLFQAPFRAGIRLDPYQLLPLSKALKLPRVNLLIADDVGLGKTIQAGLMVAELTARGLAHRVLVLSPASLRSQWAAELNDRFGLSAAVFDHAALAEASANLPIGVPAACLPAA